MIAGTFEKVRNEGEERMVQSVDGYLKELDKTVEQTISTLETEKNKGVNELNAQVSGVLKDCNEIVSETLLEMKAEAYQIANEWDVTYYARVTGEWLASFGKVLLKILGYILLIIIAIIVIIILIIVLIITGVIDALIVIVSAIIRYLVPMFVRWIGKVILQFLRRVVMKFVNWIVKKVGKELLKAIGRWLVKWIGRALVSWGLYEGFKSIFKSFDQSLSTAKREQMMFDGVVLIGTSVLAEWKLIKSIYRGKTSYKAFKALSKLSGDAKVANKLLTAAKGDMELATSIATRMKPDELRVIINFVDNATDLERALTLTGNNGKALLNLMESTGNFKKVVTLLDKSGGDTALLNRLLPKFNSADELIVMLDRVKDPAKLEKLLGVTKDVGKLSDDALKGLLKMTDDELLALQGKNIVEIEAAVINKGLNLEAEGAVVSTAEVVVGVNATGQLHHLLSNKIVSALDRHPTLKGAFSREDPRFLYNALDEAAHKGYQTWHRQYDKMVVDWLSSNPQATPQMFKSYLHDLYQQPWLQERIPNVNLNW